MKKKLKDSILFLFLASILLHLFVFTGAGWLGTYEPIDFNEETIELVVFETDEQKMQIVDQDKYQVNDEVPDEAKYLGRHNQKVLKETRAAHNGRFTNQAEPGQRVKGNTQAPKQEKQSRVVEGDLPSLDQLKPTFSRTPKAEKRQVSKAGKASQTDDYLKDVDKGIQTLLSTREFVYFSYYQRIRDKLRSRWEPLIREKVRKVFASGRTIASAKDRITRVVIILDPKGSLITVKIVGKSGLTDLDDAAVEAFRAAEPFPNPPKGIVEADGTIKIRWDFVLEANSAPPANKKPQFARGQEP